MNDDKKELNPGADDQGGLNNLPEKELKETKEILDEIEKETKPPSDPKAPADGGKDKPPVATPPADPKKPEEVKPKDGDGKPDENKEDRRDVSLMPAWQHKAAESKWNKERNELTTKIEALSKPAATPPAPGEPAKPTAPAPDVKAKLAEIAEQSGMPVESVTAIYELAAANSGKIPKDVEERLSKIDTLTAEREKEVEDAKFTSDFSRLIVPLIKKEYGDDVSQDVIQKIQNDLKSVAYTPEYSKVPYSEIYRGKDNFRGIIPPPKRGAEPTRGGYAGAKSASGEAPVKPYEEYTDDEVSKLQGEDFDKYCDYMEKFEKGKSKSA